MNSIAFKNFRRFRDLTSILYGGITFLVGRNNSGKSTLVKALLLLDNYFKSGNIYSFSFSNMVLEDANIVTYGRALNRKANKAKENFIWFEQGIENYLIELTISGEDEKTFGNVQTLIITDTHEGIEYNFNIANKHITINKSYKHELAMVIRSVSAEIKKQLADIEKQLANTDLKKTSKEYIELNAKKESLNNQLKNAKFDPDEVAENTFSVAEDFNCKNSLAEIVTDLLDHSTVQYQQDFAATQKEKQPSEKFIDLQAFNDIGFSNIEESFQYFMRIMQGFSITYLGANTIKQSALFSIRDKDNALAQAIHEYMQLGINQGDKEHRFVLKWMKDEFKVGEDFSISMVAGEAYQMKIHSNDEEMHLADLGMGSIQIMLLLLRIACCIRKIENEENDSNDDRYRVTNRTTLIIEEPELNLHPALQSKLADLFHNVHINFKIDFLVETHSEYLIRKMEKTLKLTLVKRLKLIRHIALN
jgi:predicted ATP-dependent endonuclease of OLD family